MTGCIASTADFFNGVYDNYAETQVSDDETQIDGKYLGNNSNKFMCDSLETPPSKKFKIDKTSKIQNEFLLSCPKPSLRHPDKKTTKKLTNNIKKAIKENKRIDYSVKDLGLLKWHDLYSLLLSNSLTPEIFCENVENFTEGSVYVQILNKFKFKFVQIGIYESFGGEETAAFVQKFIHEKFHDMYIYYECPVKTIQNLFYSAQLAMLRDKKTYMDSGCTADVNFIHASGALINFSLGGHSFTYVFRKDGSDWMPIPVTLRRDWTTGNDRIRGLNQVRNNGNELSKGVKVDVWPDAYDVPAEFRVFGSRFSRYLGYFKSQHELEGVVEKKLFLIDSDYKKYMPLQYAKKTIIDLREGDVVLSGSGAFWESMFTKIRSVDDQFHRIRKILDMDSDKHLSVMFRDKADKIMRKSNRMQNFSVIALKMACFNNLPMLPNSLSLLHSAK